MQRKRGKKPRKKKKAPDKPACNSLPQRAIEVSVQVAASTREQAENEVHDRILGECEADRVEQKDQCHTGKCDEGNCVITYELAGSIVCTPRHLGQRLVWVCSYEGRVTHRCICES